MISADQAPGIAPFEKSNVGESAILSCHAELADMSSRLHILTALIAALFLLRAEGARVHGTLADPRYVPLQPEGGGSGEVDRCSLCMWFVETMGRNSELGGKYLFDSVHSDRCNTYYQVRRCGATTKHCRNEGVDGAD